MPYTEIPLKSLSSLIDITVTVQVESDWVKIILNTVDVAKTVVERNTSTSFKTFMTKLEKVVHIVEGASEVN